MARQRQSLEKKKEEEIRQAKAQSQLYGVLFMVGIVVVVGLGAYFFITRDQPLPELNPDFDVESVEDNSVSYEMAGQQHIPDSEPREYNSNPPTSGPHNARWITPIGTFTEELNDYMLVHNLEHGHVWLSYRDADDEEAIAILRAIQEKYPDRVVVSYRPANDSRIAAAAWTQLLTLDELDSDQLEAFIVRYSDQAPESILGR